MPPRVAKNAPENIVEDTADEVRETVEAVIQAGQETAARTCEQAVVMTREQIEQAGRQLFRSYDEMAAFGKQYVDALLQAGAVVARGLEDMGKELLAYTQSSMEMSISVGKAMLTVKSLRELLDLQTEFAKDSFEKALAETTKLSELSMTIANQAMEPVHTRLTQAVERIGKPVAA